MSLGLAIVVFVVGTSTLGAEIAAARLLAPSFGASTIVWANTIGVTLVALSLGSSWGGRIADREPSLDGLLRILLLGAVLLGAVPYAAGVALDPAVATFDGIGVGASAGSLAAVLGLVAVPVLVLGMVSPYAIRLSVRRVADAGRTAGRLYAISTVGSMVGTFSSALLLVPLAGTRRTFLVFALGLALVAVAGLRRWRFLPVPLVLGALIALPAGTAGVP